ncbi:alpha/beta hydrolase [Nostoc sp. 3335mG]|nr:alpha/beta hydrolase [Nostoc sp. 3335mG]
MAETALPPESDFDRRSYPEGMQFPVWTAADGWPHRAYRWPAGGNRRGSMLFQSGRADYIEKYLEACDHWHGQGWDIEGFDWRGQGGSRAFTGTLDPDDRTSFDPLIDDLAEFVEDWKARTPGPHVLVAHSMGGHVALRACAERGLTFDALVLVAPMLALNTGYIPRIVASAVVEGAKLARLGHRAIFRDNYSNPRRYLRLTASLPRYEDSQYWKQAIPGIAMGPPTWNWIGAALAGDRRIAGKGELEGVRTPVLLLAAGLDKLVRDDAISAAAQRLPDAEMKLFPTGRHELLREADENRLPALAAIDDFLDRRTAR